MADFQSSHTGAEIDAGITSVSGKADSVHSHTESEITDLDKYSTTAVDSLISLMVESDITGLTGATKVNYYVVITQAGYDAIVTKDPNTVYDVY